ncbi:helix-turn-helix domain-containing protein [Pandoraea sp. SD6-2]|uniref:helix-turn-helix domain-containing protein n=1 Tax=Pandoraea sp. SD6-2 TaxID=1286093 RepID=UPI00033028C7|nr:helix-turn-helix transcriptional regulator [Pandoraea sp. SD6-2]EON15010.1 transcriptional regulator lambda-like DNA-binding repressor [Pandoraea sp. SD6-2]
MRTDIGIRLREERLRLGYSQTEFAALGGASKRSQIDWESGKTSPTAEVLAVLTEVGVDALYVLTGTRSVQVKSALTWEEQALLENYRHSSPGDQAVIRRMGLALSKPAVAKRRNGTTDSE